MKFLALLLLLCTTSFLAAAETSKGEAFRRAAQAASFYCEMNSSMLNAATTYRDSKQNQYSDELSSCISEKGAVLTEALKAIPNDPENNDLRTAAKNVYSTWLAYSGVLLRGVSSSQQKVLPEGIAFRKALSDYQTELVLASP